MSSGRLMKVRKRLKNEKLALKSGTHYCISANEIYLTESPGIHFPLSTLSKYESKKIVLHRQVRVRRERCP